ncbi:MAG: FAD-linked oxidase [Peptococcaceae bacterium BICA1-7]|nr:MAG: FAD-linked oxidase [Peptococcaceae bacterium BICA1-7]HBV95509.1 FAD-binding oxidoreductase [Desulfotomaculum sp.]
MKRWNGWGEINTVYPLPPTAGIFLEERIGRCVTPGDVTLEESVKKVPPSRLPDHPLVSRDPENRLRHSAGQSLGDWIRLRSGTVATYPDGVACPETSEDVREVLKYAENTGARVIPYGGGTSVVGHLSAPSGDRPVVTVDMGRMNRLVRMDGKGCLATFQAGVRGPDLEAALRAEGYTLGHFPQSFEYSTLGGWVATRSAGQFSLGYGRIERLFAGGSVETPVGRLDLPVFPASAAGPDLKEVVMGSEGRLGIITDAAVKISPLPGEEIFNAAFFPDTEQGIASVREMARASLPLTMIRLSLPEETTTNLTLAGHSRALELLRRWLAFKGVGEGKCMLIYGAVGSRKKVRWALNQAVEIIKAHRGAPVGARPGREWMKNRFRAPYLRNTLWERGYAVDTLETALTWKHLPGAVQSIEAALKNGLSEIGEKVFVFTHLSHVYLHGSSIYVTYLYRVAPDPAETLRRWRVLKGAASEAIVRSKGTISHQHGVGEDHLPYLKAEKGDLGMKIIGGLCSALDPGGMMNPGKLTR